MPARKHILYATTNPSKLTRMREILKDFPLDIAGLIDIPGAPQIEEDGRTPEANALKKVRHHFERQGLPTLAVDSGLTIDRFPAHKQPGIFVRRIYGADHDVSDEQMLAYYTRELAAVGGQSTGSWITAVALMLSSSKIYSTTLTSETLLVAKMSPTLMPGEPLNSLQIDPATGKYFSEMTAAQRVAAQHHRASGVYDFIHEHWTEI